jgi:hypothetical protein
MHNPHRLMMIAQKLDYRGNFRLGEPKAERHLANKMQLNRNALHLN